MTRPLEFIETMPDLTSSFFRGVITASHQGIFASDIADNVIGAALRETGTSGLDEIGLAAKFFSPADNVLVVGAHIGTVAIGLARRCRHVTAIEANPWTYKLLECNIILNEVRNITAHNFAANDKSEKIRFVMNTHNSGGSKRFPIAEHKDFFYDRPDIVEVQAHSLDEQLGANSYALVFMDIEGSEYFGLRGMTRILQTAATLIVEFYPLHLSHVAGVTPEQFAAVLTPHFAKLYVPTLNAHFTASQFGTALRTMFDANRGDPAIVFSKGD